MRPILLMPAPRIDHNRRIKEPIAPADPTTGSDKTKEEVILLFKWRKRFINKEN